MQWHVGRIVLAGDVVMRREKSQVAGFVLGEGPHHGLAKVGQSSCQRYRLSARYLRPDAADHALVTMHLYSILYFTCVLIISIASHCVRALVVGQLGSRF